MPVDAPLTFGQLSTWRSIETFAPDRLMEVNVPASWDVHGLDTGRILRALKCLADRHESLRTTYHLVDGMPIQRVHESMTPRIEVVERAEEDPRDPAETVARLYQRIFPVSGDPGWAGVLVTVRGRPSFLALSLSHMVVDVWAVRELETQFRALAAQAGPGAAEDAPEAGPSPRELAELQRGESWLSRRRGAEKYWTKVLTTGPVRNLPEPPARQGERRVQAAFRSRRLAALVGQAAAAHGVSPQSVLTALTAAGLARTVGRDRVMLSLMCANRFDAQWQSIISSMNQLIPLACDADPGTTLVKHLKRTHLNALMAYRHGCYDVDAAADLIDRVPGPDGTAFVHDCWFNYVAEPAAPRSAAAEAGTGAELAWTTPPRNAGHPFYVRVNGDAGSWLEITLRADPDLVPPGDIIRVLKTIALGAQRAAEEPESTLGTLDDDLGQSLDPELFPYQLPAPPHPEAAA